MRGNTWNFSFFYTEARKYNFRYQILVSDFIHTHTYTHLYTHMIQINRQCIFWMLLLILAGAPERRKCTKIYPMFLDHYSSAAQRVQYVQTNCRFIMWNIKDYEVVRSTYKLSHWQFLIIIKIKMSRSCWRARLRVRSSSCTDHRNGVGRFSCHTASTTVLTPLTGRAWTAP